MADTETIGAVLKVLTKAYPGRFEVDRDTAEVYARLLADIPDTALMAAAVHHTTMSKWPPSVAELREAAFNLMDGHGAPSAGDAWALVGQTIHRYGTYNQGAARASLPPLIWRAVEALGGWRYLCLSEEPMADRAHFLRIYEQLAARDSQEQRMLPEVRAVADHYAALGEGEKREALLPGVETIGDVLARVACDLEPIHG